MQTGAGRGVEGRQGFRVQESQKPKVQGTQSPVIESGGCCVVQETQWEPPAEGFIPAPYEWSHIAAPEQQTGGEAVEIDSAQQKETNGAAELEDGGHGGLEAALVHLRVFGGSEPVVDDTDMSPDAEGSTEGRFEAPARSAGAIFFAGHGGGEEGRGGGNPYLLAPNQNSRVESISSTYGFAGGPDVLMLDGSCGREGLSGDIPMASESSPGDCRGGGLVRTETTGFLPKGFDQSEVPERSHIRFCKGDSDGQETGAIEGVCSKQSGEGRQRNKGWTGEEQEGRRENSSAVRDGGGGDE